MPPPAEHRQKGGRFAPRPQWGSDISRDSSLLAAPARGTQGQSGKRSSGLQGEAMRLRSKQKQGQHPGRATRKLLHGAHSERQTLCGLGAKESHNEVLPVLNFQVHITVPLPVERETPRKTRTFPTASLTHVSTARPPAGRQETLQLLTAHHGGTTEAVGGLGSKVIAVLNFL